MRRLPTADEVKLSYSTIHDEVHSMDYEAGMKGIDAFFNPKSIAVIGATGNAMSAGGMVLNNIFKGDGHGNLYKGDIYLINKRLKGEKLYGQPTYASLKDIPAESVDLGIVIVPARFVREVITQLGELKAKCATIITAGFAEMQSYSDDSLDKQQEILDEAEKYGIRLVGPNCNGIYSATTFLNCIFGPGIKMLSGSDIPGGVSMVSKGGTAGLHTIIGATLRSFGVDKFIAIGDECDLTVQDIIAYYNWDPDTRVIAVYSEGIKDGRKFLEIMRQVNKPVVMYKSGQTNLGRRAALSHVGAMSSNNSAKLFDGMARQTGLLRAQSIDELVEICQVLTKIPQRPKGKNIGILTSGGSIGVMQSDACARAGLSVPDLRKEDVEKLSEVLTPYWSHNNPIDLTDSGMNPANIMKALMVLLEDRNIDGIFLLGMMAPMDTEIYNIGMNENVIKLFKAFVAEQSKTIKALMEKYEKPILFIGEYLNESSKIFMRHGLPVVHDFDIAARTFASISNYESHVESVVDIAN